LPLLPVPFSLEIPVPFSLEIYTLFLPLLNHSVVFVWGWERGLSPFSILRGIGPLGPLWVGKYSSRRFAAQSEEDVRDLHAYIYNTSIMRGSGEYCICTCLHGLE